MKQHQLIYHNKKQFTEALCELHDSYPDKTAIVRIFYNYARISDLSDLTDILDERWPEAEYFGCSSTANIENGCLATDSISAIFTIFEHEDSKVCVIPYSIPQNTREQLCDDIIDQVADRPWVKGVEILVTVREGSTTYFCDRLSELDESIAVYGGCACSDIDVTHSNVLSKSSGVLDYGVVFVLVGGDELHIKTDYVSGWKPLGQKLSITKAIGNRLYEFGGKPAFETYNHYLRIENDENFFLNALEFPLSYERNGIDLLRVPFACLDDGSLLMTSDIDKGSEVHISYGDPHTIMSNLYNIAAKLADFVPEGIVIYNCATRRSFWGDRQIDRESMPFCTIADTAGFYTAGEFQRTGRSISMHNVTLVIVGMREGEAGVSRKQEFLDSCDFQEKHISTVNRLANFIDVSTRELEAANQRLANANVLLTQIATTDELTGLFNRREIKNRITASTAELGGSGSYALIMLDLDNFKMINDSYGHSEGDLVLRGFAELMSELTSQEENGSVGRWGGEEFMILLPNTSEKTARSLAESIRIKFSEMRFAVSGSHTVSCGVTLSLPKESAEEACMRADCALYTAKANGRNCTYVM